MLRPGCLKVSGLPWLARPLLRRIPCKVIGRAGSPLLYRWHLFGRSGGPFALMVHLFAKSDPDCLHDHPWSFWSLVLARGYWEDREGLPPIWRRPWSLAYRPAEYKHRVRIEPGRFPLTLVLHLRRRREWGFWTLRGWVPWQSFDDRADLCGEAAKGGA